MTAGVVDNERPPYVAFERRPIEDRTASLASGGYKAVDRDFAILTRPGSRDTVEKEVLEWFKELDRKLKAEQIPLPWVQGFKAGYKAWLEGEEAPASGTPIKGWSVLSPAAQKELLHAGVRTVEDLAQMGDSDLTVLGTGATSFRAKARTWLESANSHGKVVEQIAALTTKLDSLLSVNATQAEIINQLKTLIPADKLKELKTNG